MGDIILKAILYVIALVLYYIEVLLCKILDIVYSMFEVFSGITYVRYKGESMSLLDVFFGNTIINTVFWGMACIGIVMTFVFAIWSVVKKTFDAYDKHKMSYGQILSNVFKSVVIILLMSTIVSVSTLAATTLMQQIDYLFKSADKIADPDEIEFNDEDYATMFRILNTVANYSLNPSFDNTYNINACFNSIRPDLQLLSKKPNFYKFSYNIKDENGNDMICWQRVIKELGVSADITTNLSLDTYNAAVNDSVLYAVEQMKTNGNFKPVEKYSRAGDGFSSYGQLLGKTVMLSCTFQAAKNEKYNSNASLNDEVRGPFYRDEKNIYSRKQVEKAFTIEFPDWNHLVALVGTVWLIKNFLVVAMNAIARIFNILLLYIAAPPFVATIPLDDGEKFKQWCVAFVIQLFGIFGTFIAVRLLVIFIPIIFSSELVLFPDSAIMDIIGKILIVIGVGFVASKASGIITGILANNAGMQSIMAGDAGAQAVSAMQSVGAKAAGLALTTAAVVGKGVANVTGATTLANKVGEGFKNFNQSMKDHGGFLGAAAHGFSPKPQQGGGGAPGGGGGGGGQPQGGADKDGGKQPSQAEIKQQMAINKFLGLDLTDGITGQGNQGGPGTKTPPPPPQK